jgi:hypothetical protein
MVGVAAQKHHAARHHLLRVGVGDLEPEHLGVKEGRALDVSYIDDDMPQFPDLDQPFGNGRPAGCFCCFLLRNISDHSHLACFPEARLDAHIMAILLLPKRHA